jgi:hypothetical protein
MESSSQLKFNAPLPSGFILQKDVYITNLLYANDQLPIIKIAKLLPFRPASGWMPQDPSSCLQIVRQNGLLSLYPENESLFYSKKKVKPKKLNNRKLKFPIPKYRYPPLSAADFHKHLRQQGIRIKYIDDDLNITSKKGKRIIYTFREDYYLKKYESKDAGTKTIIKKKDHSINEDFNNYFDFGFHSRNENNKILINTKFKKKRSASQRRTNILSKKIYAKDKTFPTQIDFNLLNNLNPNTKLVRARTAKI